jgi:hypothetical protein
MATTGIQDQLLAAVLKALPEAFSLTAFAGEKFRASPTASYIDDEGVARIYVQRWAERTKTWEDFTKGSPAELMRELADRKVRTKVQHAIAECVPYSDLESFAKAIAERHTVLNLGQPWPEVSYQQLRSEAESDEMYDGIVEEFRSWLKDARKEANMVADAGLPWTLASAEDAFMKRGVFAKQKKAAPKRKAGPPVTRKLKKAGAK